MFLISGHSTEKCKLNIINFWSLDWKVQITKLSWGIHGQRWHNTIICCNAWQQCTWLGHIAPNQWVECTIIGLLARVIGETRSAHIVSSSGRLENTPLGREVILLLSIILYRERERERERVSKKKRERERERERVCVRHLLIYAHTALQTAYTVSHRKTIHYRISKDKQALENISTRCYMIRSKQLDTCSFAPLTMTWGRTSTASLLGT